MIAGEVLSSSGQRKVTWNSFGKARMTPCTDRYRKVGLPSPTPLATNPQLDENNQALNHLPKNRKPNPHPQHRSPGPLVPQFLVPALLSPEP